MNRPPAQGAGERLRELRTARGWSQEELASRAALSVTTVRRYERGNLPRPLEPLLKIAELLETSVDELVLDADPNPCRRAILERLAACSALPPHLAPFLVAMIDVVLNLHRGVEELVAWRSSEEDAFTGGADPAEAGGRFEP
jgi:transcriptional regulator with XRE-family HTH domain